MKHGGGSLSRRFEVRPGAALDLIGGAIAWGAHTEYRLEALFEQDLVVARVFASKPE
jgi:hypothetical protein